MALHKKDKFKKKDEIWIRSQLLPNGKIIVFGISGTELSKMSADEQNADFDSESDKIIKELGMTDSNRVFQYAKNHGFHEVDSDKQEWFIF